MPRIRRSEKTRELLLEQGISLLSEHGYHGTGLKLILDTVKVPKGSFYNYFESKEHFAAEILDTYAGRLLVEFDAYIDQTEDSPLQVIEYVYNTMTNTMEAEGCLRGCLLGNMAAEIGGQSELCRASMLETLKQWKHHIIALIENGQSTGEIRSDITSEQLADLLWCAWEGSVLRMKMEGNTKTVRETLNLVINKLFRPTA